MPRPKKLDPSKELKLTASKTEGLSEPAKSDTKEGISKEMKKQGPEVERYWRHAMTFPDSNDGYPILADFTPPDQSILNDIRYVRVWGEEQYANSALFKSVINMITSHACPGHFEFSMDLPNAPEGSDRARVNDEIERHFKKWKGQCDAAGYQTLNQLIKKITRTVLLYGEAFAIIVGDKKSKKNGGYLTKLRGIAPARVASPTGENRDPDRMRDGVEVGPTGDNPVRLWVKKGKNGTDYNFIPYFDDYGNRLVCHAFDRIFDGQTRGHNPIVAVYKMMYHLGRFVESEVRAAMNSSQISVVPTLNNPSSIGEQNGKVWDDAIAPVNGRRREVPVVTIDPGKWFILEQGEKLESFKMERPNGMFIPFVEYIEKKICAAYGCVRSYVFSEWSDSNFTAARAAMLQTQTHLKNLQEIVVEAVLVPLVRTFIQEICTDGTVQRGSVKLEEILDNFHLIPPHFPVVDPNRELLFISGMVDNKFMTHQQAIKHFNPVGDYMEIYQQLGREQEESIKQKLGVAPQTSPTTAPEENKTPSVSPGIKKPAKKNVAVVKQPKIPGQVGRPTGPDSTRD